MKGKEGKEADMNEGHEHRCSDKLFTSFFNTVLPAASHRACQVSARVGEGEEVPLMPSDEERKLSWRGMNRKLGLSGTSFSEIMTIKYRGS